MLCLRTTATGHRGHRSALEHHRPPVFRYFEAVRVRQRPRLDHVEAPDPEHRTAGGVDVDVVGAIVSDLHHHAKGIAVRGFAHPAHLIDPLRKGHLALHGHAVHARSLEGGLQNERTSQQTVAQSGVVYARIGNQAVGSDGSHLIQHLEAGTVEEATVDRGPVHRFIGKEEGRGQRIHARRLFQLDGGGEVVGLDDPTAPSLSPTPQRATHRVRSHTLCTHHRHRLRVAVELQRRGEGDPIGPHNRHARRGPTSRCSHELQPHHTRQHRRAVDGMVKNPRRPLPREHGLTHHRVALVVQPIEDGVGDGLVEVAQSTGHHQLTGGSGRDEVHQETGPRRCREEVDPTRLQQVLHSTPHRHSGVAPGGPVHLERPRTRQTHARDGLIGCGIVNLPRISEATGHRAHVHKPRDPLEATGQGHTARRLHLKDAAEVRHGLVGELAALFDARAMHHAIDKAIATAHRLHGRSETVFIAHVRGHKEDLGPERLELHHGLSGFFGLSHRREALLNLRRGGALALRLELRLDGFLCRGLVEGLGARRGAGDENQPGRAARSDLDGHPGGDPPGSPGEHDDRVVLQRSPHRRDLFHHQPECLPVASVEEDLGGGVGGGRFIHEDAGGFFFLQHRVDIDDPRHIGVPLPAERLRRTRTSALLQSHLGVYPAGIGPETRDADPTGRRTGVGGSGSLEGVVDRLACVEADGHRGVAQCIGIGVHATAPPLQLAAKRTGEGALSQDHHRCAVQVIGCTEDRRIGDHGSPQPEGGREGRRVGGLARHRVFLRGAFRRGGHSWSPGGGCTALVEKRLHGIRQSAHCGVAARGRHRIGGKTETLTQLREHLGLLDGVNSEVGFQLIAFFELVGVVAGLVGEGGAHKDEELVTRGPLRRCRRCRSIRRRFRDRRGRRGLGRYRPGATHLQRSANGCHEGSQGKRTVGLHLRLGRNAQLFSQVRKHLGLLDRVDSKIGFELVVLFELRRIVAGLVGENRPHQGGKDFLGGEVCGRSQRGRRRGGCGSRRRGWRGRRRRSRHRSTRCHPCDGVGQRSQSEGPIGCHLCFGIDAQALPQLRQHLCLLDRIHAEVGFQLVVFFELIRIVASLFGQHRPHHREQATAIGGNRLGASSRHRCRAGAGRGGRGRGPLGTGSALCRRNGIDQPRNGEGTIGCHFLLGGHAQLFTQLRQHLRLLDRVHAEVGFQLVVVFKLGGVVAGLCREDAPNQLRQLRPICRAGGPGRSHRLGRGGGLRCHHRFRHLHHPEGALFDFQRRRRIARDLLQPRPLGRRVGPRISTGHRFPDRQGQLGAEARRESDGKAHRAGAPRGEREVAQLFVAHLQVRHRRDNLVLQGLESDGIFNTRPHRVPREALGIGHHHMPGGFAEGGAQPEDLRSRRAPARGRVGLVAHKEGILRHGRRGDPGGRTGPLHHAAHLRGDVVGIEAGAMECAVGNAGGQQAGDGGSAARPGILFALEYQSHRSHSEDHTVATGIEGQGAIFHLVGGGGRPGREEAGPDPGQHLVVGDIVGPHHHHALRPTGTDPVFGDGHGLRGACAGGIHAGVGTAGTDELGKLAVAHTQHLKEEAAVKAAFAIVSVGLHVLHQVGVPGEGTRKDDAGAVSQSFWQLPAHRDLPAGAGGAGDLDERNARIPQRFQTRSDGQNGGDVERTGQAAVNAIVGGVHPATDAGKVDELVAGVDRLECALAGLRVFLEPHNLAGQQGIFISRGEMFDAVFPGEDARHIVGRKDLRAAGKTQAGSRGHHRHCGQCRGPHGAGLWPGCGGGRSRLGQGGRQGRLQRGDEIGEGRENGLRHSLCGTFREAGPHRSFRKGLKGSSGDGRRAAGDGGGGCRATGDWRSRATPDRSRRQQQRLVGDRAGGRQLGRPGGTEPLPRVVRQVAQALELAQAEVGVVLQLEAVPEAGHHLGLLHGVHAKVGLELIIGRELFRGVAGEVAHQLEHFIEHVAGGRLTAGRSRSGGAQREALLDGPGGGQARLRHGEDGGLHRLAPHRQPQRNKGCKGIVEGSQLPHLRVIGEDGPVGTALQGARHEARERPLRATLDKDPRPLGVHALHLRDPLHRGRHLLREEVKDGFAGLGIPAAGDIGGDGTLRRTDVEPLQHLAQRTAGGGHHAGVEGMADRQRMHRDSPRPEGFHGRFDRVGLAGDDRLRGAVLVGGHHIAWNLGQHFDDLLLGGSNARHAAGVVNLDRSHLAPPGADGDEGVFEGHDARRHHRSVLPEGVARDHVGEDPEAGQEAGDGDVDREGGRLRDGRVLQADELLGLRQARVGADEGGERTPQLRQHDPVGFGEGLCHDGVPLCQLEPHADVLAALSGEQEGHLSVEGFFLQGNPPRAKHGPIGASLQRLSKACELGGAGLFVGGGRHHANGCAGLKWRQRMVGGAGHQLGTVFSREGPQACRQRRAFHGGQHRGRRRCAFGTALFQDHMEVGATKAKGADPGPTGAHALPALGTGLHLEGNDIEAHIRARRLEARRRRQDAVVNGEGGLDQAGSAGRALEVTDVALHTADAHGTTRPAPPGAHKGRQGVHLHLVTHHRARAVGLDEVHLGRVDARGLIGPLQRVFLTSGVGRSDPLALAIAGAPNALDDRVNAVAIALGIRETLEDENPSAFPHHKAIGRRIEGHTVARREGANLAELGVGGHAHGAVGPTGDGHVEVTLLQTLHRRLNRGHGAGTGRIHRKVGAGQVEGVGHTARDDIGQLPGHGIFVDGRQPLDHILTEGREDGLLGGRGKLLEVRDGGQGLLKGRYTRPHGVVVGVLAPHRVAENHGAGGAVEVVAGLCAGQRLEPGIFEGVGHRLEGDLLHRVDGPGHPGRDAEATRVKLEALQEAANLRIGLVDDRLVCIPEQGRVPALLGHLDDGVAAIEHHLPEVGHRVGPGEATTQPHNGDRLGRARHHGANGGIRRAHGSGFGSHGIQQPFQLGVPVRHLAGPTEGEPRRKGHLGRVVGAHPPLGLFPEAGAREETTEHWCQRRRLDAETVDHVGSGGICAVEPGPQSRR